MPRKYLRMTRRRTCVTPDLAGRGKMICCSGSLEPLLFLQKKPLSSDSGKTYTNL